MPETDPINPETPEDRFPETAGSRPVGDSSRQAGRTDRSRPARHRGGRGGRAPYLVAGLVALLGLGVAGGVTIVAGGGGDQRVAPVSAAADESDRSAAAQRADRSGREGTAAPTLSPTPTPTTAAPSTSPEPRTSGSASRSSGSAPAAKPTASRRPAAWVDPMPGAGTTSCFGMRWGTMHAGIDLAMPADTPIRAVGAGTVVTAGWAYPGYGISVVIDHGNGFLTHYAHQSRTVVSVGQRVSAGKVIGYEGSTGDSTGPHLHFEVHNGLWNQVDPAPWMRERGVDLGC